MWKKLCFFGFFVGEFVFFFFVDSYDGEFFKVRCIDIFCWFFCDVVGVVV